MSKEDAIEVEASSGRERSRGPGHAFLRDGVEKREPAAEILSEAKDLVEQRIQEGNE